MSQETSPMPKRPPRPQRPDPSRLQSLRLNRLTRAEDIHEETCSLSQENESLPTSKFSDVSSAKDVAPARPPPPVLNKAVLSQTTESEDLNSPDEMSDIRNSDVSWNNENKDGTVDDPAYIDVLPSERNLRESSPMAKYPARPPAPDPLRLRTLRYKRLIPTEDKYTLSPVYENVPTCIDVLSDMSPAKDVAPARPPPPALNRAVLYQTTESEDLDNQDEASDIRYTETSWNNENDEGRVDGLLPNETCLPESSPMAKYPARPPPPDPSRVQTLRYKRLIPTKDKYTLSPVNENVPTYIDVLSDMSPAKDVAPARPPPPALNRAVLYQTTESEDLDNQDEASDIRYTETSWNNENDEGRVDGILPNETCLPNNTTPVKARPPRPVDPSRLSLLQPRKPLLCQSRSAEPIHHVYESIDNILSQNKSGEKGLVARLARKGRSTTYHAWSEAGSKNKDSSANELDILLEWWRSIGGLENLQTDYQEEESVRKPLISVAQRLKTAMRLYELLLVQRCTDLLNNITELHCIADSLVKSDKKTRLAKLTGGTTGAVGGVTIAAGLALAPLTFGASLVATGVGIGIVAAGGVTGASASFSKKMKSTQLKDKMEKILNNYKAQVEDILACLRFIDIGMAHLRKQDDSKLKEMGEHLWKIGKIAQEMKSINSVDAISECFGILQSLDPHFIEEDNPRTKKYSNNQLAQKVHEIADKLKDCTDQLLWIKKLFQSADDNV